eukprot:Awhi_evm1s11239
MPQGNCQQNTATCSTLEGSTDLGCSDCVDGFYVDGFAICTGCSTQTNCKAGQHATTCSTFGGSTELGCNDCADGFYSDGFALCK